MNIEQAFAAAFKDVDAQFDGLSDTNEIKEYAKDILALSDREIHSITTKGTLEKFKANIKCTLTVGVAEFIRNYSERNNETLKIAVKKPLSKSSCYKLWNIYRCHHKTRYEKTKNIKSILQSKPSKRFKNTDCQFMLEIKQMRLRECDFQIAIEWNHNHPVNSLQAWTYKQIPDDVLNHVKSLYEKGNTPSIAYREYMRDVRESCKNDLDYHMKKADRSKCPRRGDFYNIYTKFCNEIYGAKNGAKMVEALRLKLEQLGKTNPGISFRQTDFNSEKQEPFILAIVTPFMKRIHEMVRQSSELVFLDSSSNMEELNLRIFLLCTHSVVGALPLGILIVSDETTDTLVKGLKELKICIGDNAFYGRCEEGPSIIMTDNCSELRDALHQVWPNARLLLCIFHIMQQVWRWLHEKKNGIQNHDRPLLLKIIKSILYEKSEEKMHELIDNIEDNFLLQKYPKARRYFESVMDVKEAWALSYRTCLKTAQNNTNNYVESQFLVIKDEILNRVKEYNVVGLVEKLTIELDYHYKTKMLSLADGSFDGIYSRRFKGMNLVKDGENAKQLEKIASKIEVLENETFLVPSFTKIDTNYLVDMNLSICECPVGFNGAPCKHQYILWTSRLTGNCSNFLPVFSAPERQTYAKIAVGSAASIEFYEGLRDRIIPCKNENILSNESSSSRSPVNQLLEHTDFTVEEDINLQEENLHSKINEVDVAKQSLKDTFDFLSNQLSKDPSIPSGVIKFSKRLLQIPSSKLGTALHNFANVYTNSDPLKINSAKKTKRMKIKVQPEAVRRRKFKNGSRQKQSKGNIADVIPRRTMITGKRKHLFSQNVSLNQPMAKKSGRSMQSKTIQRNDRK